MANSVYGSSGHNGTFSLRCSSLNIQHENWPCLYNKYQQWKKNTSHSHHPHHLSFVYLRPKTLKLLLHHCPAKVPRSRWHVWFAKDANWRINPGFFFVAPFGLDPSLNDKQQKRLWKKKIGKGIFSPMHPNFSGANLLLVFRQKAYPICEPWVEYPGFKMVSFCFWCFVFKSGFTEIIRLLAV